MEDHGAKTSVVYEDNYTRRMLRLTLAGIVIIQIEFLGLIIIAMSLVNKITFLLNSVAQITETFLSFKGLLDWIK